MSAIEALTNTIIGFLGSLLITWALLAWWNIGPLGNAAAITGACTIWSLLRGYYIRRFFNRYK